MTTTAAAWRHVGGHHHLATRPDPCPCTTPTPDPSSPCGFVGCTGGDAHLCYCRFRESRDFHPLHHPHQPTRCIACGHPLEAVR